MPDGSAPPDKPPKGGPKAVSDALDQAETRRRKKPPRPPRDPDDDGGFFRVPKDCPVQPLGIDGKLFLFMDANKQFVALTAKDFGGHGLSALFGDHQLYLDNAWPRLSAKGDPLGLDKDRAARSLMAACARLGVFDSDNKVRGVGAWTDADGRLVWHLGDAVLVTDTRGRQSLEEVGLIGDHLYPQGVPQIRPNTARGKPAKSIDRLYDLLQSWHWKRGEIDARLQLGWLGCAIIGGALRWRPAVWATGGQGTGKSTLHDHLLNPVLGGDASVVQTADATGPGLYQALKNRSTPVVFDELEPNPEDRTRVATTIKLARLSASGARIVRGSPDGTHKEFVARAEFLFSSILIPRLEPELAMRICILDLLALGERKEPVLTTRDMLDIGHDLRRRLVERWAYWPGRLARWREEMRKRGFAARVADTWATLLAMADQLLAPTDDIADVHQDEIDKWTDELRPHLDQLVQAAGSDSAGLLRRMLTSTVDPYSKGQRWPLSTLISIASARSEQGEDPDPDGMSHDRAESGLETLGLKIIYSMPPRPEGDDADRPRLPTEKIWALAIANDHAEVNKLLTNTKWTAGVYTQTLLRVPGAWSTQQRIARNKIQCAMIPLDAVLPKEGDGGDMFTT